MFKNLRTSAAIVAALSVLAVLPVLPATLTAETGTRPAEITSAKATEPGMGGTSESPPKMDGNTRQSTLEKLSLEKLTLEKPAPEKPTPTEPILEKPIPTPEPAQERDRDTAQNSDKDPERLVNAGVASTPVLPGPAQAPAKHPSETVSPTPKPGQRDDSLLLSIPRLGLENVPVGDSREQAYLDQEGIMHLSGTGFPYKSGSNTYIAGHAGDYKTSRIPNVFRNLNNLRRGDHIILRDTTGKTYDYRVYKGFIVNPRDVWVTKPVRDKQIVSLQTCFPAPTFEKRLVIRGVLVS